MKPRIVFVLFFILTILNVSAQSSGGIPPPQSKNQTASLAKETLEERLKSRRRSQSTVSQPKTFTLPPLSVTLSHNAVSVTLEVEITLTISEKKVEKTLKSQLKEVLGTIQTILTTESLENLSSIDWRNNARKEIEVILNSILEEDPQLKAIYVLQQDPIIYRGLEHLGLIPRIDSNTLKVARDAARQFWRVTEEDMPIREVKFRSFIIS